MTSAKYPKTISIRYIQSNKYQHLIYNKDSAFHVKDTEAKVDLKCEIKLLIEWSSMSGPRWDQNSSVDGGGME